MSEHLLYLMWRGLLGCLFGYTLACNGLGFQKPAFWLLLAVFCLYGIPEIVQ